MHGAGDEPPVEILRFPCNTPRCRQVFTVLPDVLAPHQPQPVAAQEQAVLRFAATLGTCSQVGESGGVSASTVWRWVQRAAQQVEEGVAQIQQWLQDVAGRYMVVTVDDSLRPRWQRRRLRQAGKVSRLLLLQRLPRLVALCRTAAAELLARHGAAQVPDGTQSCLAFCWWLLPGLSGSICHTQTEKARRPRAC